MMSKITDKIISIHNRKLDYPRLFDPTQDYAGMVTPLDCVVIFLCETHTHLHTHTFEFPSMLICFDKMIEYDLLCVPDNDGWLSDPHEGKWWFADDDKRTIYRGWWDKHTLFMDPNATWAEVYNPVPNPDFDPYLDAKEWLKSQPYIVESEINPDCV
jgi:hypothetical protein